MADGKSPTGRPKRYHANKAKLYCPLPVIYALIGKTNQIIRYVGQTINLEKRIQSYRCNNSVHNADLGRWLRKNEWEVKILDLNPPDLNASERYFIKKHRETVFNLNGGEERNWRSRNREPWMAGKGIMCPSDMILNRYMNQRGPKYHQLKKEVDELRTKMSVYERVYYEVTLAMEWYDKAADIIERWLSYTEPKLISVLQEGRG